MTIGDDYSQFLKAFVYPRRFRRLSNFQTASHVSRSHLKFVIARRCFECALPRALKHRFYCFTLSRYLLHSFLPLTAVLLMFGLPKE